MFEDDKTLSETLISSATALQKWEEIRPVATDFIDLVNEYHDVIDGVSTVFGIVGFVWSIYSNLEKSKQEMAQQQAMIQQITRAVDGMISRATIEIKHYIDQKEVRAAVIAANAVQQGFRHDFLPHVTTFPAKGFDLGPLDLLINDARKVIETLYDIFSFRVASGDGAACLTLYRNLHAVVQCKLIMNKWRHGVTLPVITEAQIEMERLSQLWIPLCSGLARMSDLSFSPGLVAFHVGNNRRGQLTKYSYYYKGQEQPTKGSNKLLVSQAFREARQAGRTNSLPQALTDWQDHTGRVLKELHEIQLRKS